MVRGLQVFFDPGAVGLLQAGFIDSTFEGLPGFGELSRFEGVFDGGVQAAAYLLGLDLVVYLDAICFKNSRPAVSARRASFRLSTAFWTRSGSLTLTFF